VRGLLIRDMGVRNMLVGRHKTAIWLACWLSATRAGAAPSLKVLWDFDGHFGTAVPTGPLAMDGAGGLYGTTLIGGPHEGQGTVFRLLRPAAGGTRWRPQILFSFPVRQMDGIPKAGVTLNAAGDVFGIVLREGVDVPLGSVFELTPSARPPFGERLIASFPPSAGGSVFTVNTPLLAGPANSLFGTTGSGNAYQLMPPAGGSGKWTRTNLWRHTGGDANLVAFNAGFSADANGNLYGVTVNASRNDGAVVRLAPPASGEGRWQEATLWEFNGFDGSAPSAQVLPASDGSVYGTTDFGGATGNGVVFRLVPPASGAGAWQFSILHVFSGGADGAIPISTVIMDSAGALYGVTTSAGPKGGGTVFRLAPPAGGGAWTLSTEWAFSDAHSDERSGYSPRYGLVADAEGTLYGVAGSGGALSSGTVFAVSGAGFVP